MKHINNHINEIKATFLNLSTLIKKREEKHKELIKRLIEIEIELKNLRIIEIGK